MTKSLRCLVSAAVLMAVVAVPVSYAKGLVIPASDCKTDWVAIDNYISQNRQPVLEPCNLNSIKAVQVNHERCRRATCCRVEARYYNSTMAEYYWVTYKWNLGQWKSNLTCLYSKSK